jgi:hypothetical protein
MKKQLLLGSALLAVISAFPQTSRTTKPAGIVDMTKIIAAKYAAEPEGSVSPKLKPVIGATENSSSPGEMVSSMPPSTINWKLVAGSMNIYGMLVSQSRPLQYNDNLNAVSFIHRKSATYNAIPTSNSGAIVAEITTNWGNTWDSTCIWSDGTNLGRYPQGAIYNPPGNTSLSNAYVVGAGPCTGGSGWLGNFYASKKLNSFDATASSSPNAQQFLSSSLSSYPANQGPHAFSRYGFGSTDDGAVRSLALIVDDPANIDGLRGFSVVKGSFNAGAFTWTTDSIIPNTIIRTDGSKVMGFAPQMAWNESGTVGYVVTMGAIANSTNSTKGYQPIVYKTTNSGASWAMVPGIDFNNSAFQPVLSRLDGLSSNTNIAVPYFNDYNMIVDANNKLHIAATLNGTSKNHPDSLGYINSYSLSIDGQEYLWRHEPGYRPFIYDFIGDGTSAWTYKLIDSVSSEAAGATAGSAGFNDNPWDDSQGKTDNVDTRIQLGRTPDGQYITFAWSESDTNATTGGRKYNSKPNVKTRCMSIGSGTNMYVVSPTEINVTKVAPGTGTVNFNVQNMATLHYMSPTTGTAAVTGNTVDINTPISVTNSNPFSQLTNNTTWIQTGKLSYSFSSLNSSIKDNLQNALDYEIYPNPASNDANLSINMQDNNSIEVAVLNAIGQLVKSNKHQGFSGQNNITIDLTGVSSGIYMVNVKVANASNTKKLIVK